MVMSLSNFYNRLVDGVGLPLPQRLVAEPAKRLSARGYDVLARLAKAQLQLSTTLEGFPITLSGPEIFRIAGTRCATR